MKTAKTFLSVIAAIVLTATTVVASDADVPPVKSVKSAVRPNEKPAVVVKPKVETASPAKIHPVEKESATPKEPAAGALGGPAKNSSRRIVNTATVGGAAPAGANHPTAVNGTEVKPK